MRDTTSTRRNDTATAARKEPTRDHPAGRRLRALLAALLALVGLAATALPAPAPAAAAGRWPLEPCYTIESRLNGYVLQVGLAGGAGAGAASTTPPAAV